MRFSWIFRLFLDDPEDRERRTWPQHKGGSFHPEKKVSIDVAGSHM